MKNIKLTTIIVLLSICTMNKGLASQRLMDKQLVNFDRLIQGEFDNYNQVNFETNDFLTSQDIPDQKHARLYKKVVRLNAPQLGEFVYYEQTHAGGREHKIYRKSISIVTPEHSRKRLVVQNYKLVTDIDVLELQQNIALKDLKTLGNSCNTEFRLQGDSFIGEIDHKKCTVKSKHGGNIHISGQFVISKAGYWHLEAGFKPDGTMAFGRKDQDYYQLTRAQRFTCWAAFKTDKLKESGEPHWDFHSKISMHDQGDISEFTTTSSVPKNYFIRLKQTVFPAGKRPNVFEMFIHENSEQAKKQYKDALSYTWTNSDAKRLGINLRWMQASCSLGN